MADYDSASLYVDTETILESANALMGQAQEVVDDLTNIGNQLSGLALSWAGQTSEDVQQINDSWTSVMTQMFGTQDSPQSGCINVIVAGLRQVGAGYSVVEWQLASMWQQFYSQLTSDATGSGGLPTSPPQNITDSSSTAVTELFSL
jgi:uncharacterized protein YukE